MRTSIKVHQLKCIESNKTDLDHTNTYDMCTQAVSNLINPVGLLIDLVYVLSTFGQNVDALRNCKHD